MMKRLFCLLAMWLAAWQLSFALAQTQEETAVITLSGESAQWTGDGVTLEDGVLTIGGTGVYRLSGSWAEGQIVVKAGKKGYVTLVLDGLSVSSSEGSPLTVTSAKEVVLRLEAGSGNTLASTAEGEDAASALVSKADKLGLEQSRFVGQDHSLDDLVTGFFEHFCCRRTALVLPLSPCSLIAEGDDRRGKGTFGIGQLCRDLIAGTDCSFLQDFRENSLSWHNAVPHTVADRAALVTLLANLGHPQHD